MANKTGMEKRRKTEYGDDLYPHLSPFMLRGKVNLGDLYLAFPSVALILQTKDAMRGVGQLPSRLFQLCI